METLEIILIIALVVLSIAVTIWVSLPKKCKDCGSNKIPLRIRGTDLEPVGRYCESCDKKFIQDFDSVN